MTISLKPKADFLRDKAASSSHQDIMADPRFMAAAKVALLEMQLNLPVDAQSVLKLVGAQIFLATLLNLGEPSAQMGSSTDQPLNPI